MRIKEIQHVLVGSLVVRNGTLGDTTRWRRNTDAVHVWVENNHSDTELRRFHEEGEHRAHLQTLFNAQAAAPDSRHRAGAGNKEKEAIAGQASLCSKYGRPRTVLAVHRQRHGDLLKAKIVDHLHLYLQFTV